MKNVLVMFLALMAVCSAQSSTALYAFGVTEPKLNYLYFVENAVPPGHLHPSVGVYYWHYSTTEQFDNDWERQDYDIELSQGIVIPTFSVGFGNVVELGMMVPIVANKSESELSSVISADGSGVGDMQIWVSTIFIQNPNFGLRAAIKIPSGEDEPAADKLATGSGQTDIDFGMIFSVKPEKVGFMCDLGTSYSLRLKKDISGYDYDPGDEGRLQLYLGGMPYDGFGVLFGGDGIISMNERIEGTERDDSYRMSSMLGLKMFYETPFGLRFDGALKFDVAGKQSAAGLGFLVGATYEPNFYGSSSGSWRR